MPETGVKTRAQKDVRAQMAQAAFSANDVWEMKEDGCSAGAYISGVAGQGNVDRDAPEGRITITCVPVRK